MSKLKTAFIEDSAITTPKIADASVTAAKLAAGVTPGTQFTQTITLSGTDITNKYAVITHAPAIPANMQMSVAGQGSQIYGVDFEYVEQAGPVFSVSWDSLALDAVLVAGDVIEVSLFY